MTKIWDIKDRDLPKIFYPIRDIWLPKEEQYYSRKKSESLHDYFIRKKLPCFCRNCVKERKLEEQKKQEILDF
jgi:hypothetical protein